MILRRAPVITAKRLVRKLPGVSHVLNLMAYEGWRHCRGVYASFENARRVIPRSRSVGFDNRESAQLYLHELDRTKPSDYAAFFWMRPILPEIRYIFDFGGNKGWSFYSFQKYLQFPPDLRWTICDLPEIVSAGREVARARGARNLEFTTEFAVAEGCELFFSSGALQFVDCDLADLLRNLKVLPRHVLINRVPLSDLPTYYTIHDTGAACSPYRIANRASFVSSIEALGYRKVDEWPCAESWCKVRLRPSLGVKCYSGYYFRLSEGQ
jgi:putative methyltransferase (TIGR04325 family)